jgi:hypothetical protein
MWADDCIRIGIALRPESGTAEIDRRVAGVISLLNCESRATSSTLLLTAQTVAALSDKTGEHALNNVRGGCSTVEVPAATVELFEAVILDAVKEG